MFSDILFKSSQLSKTSFFLCPFRTSNCSTYVGSKLFYVCFLRMCSTYAGEHAHLHTFIQTCIYKIAYRYTKICTFKLNQWKIRSEITASYKWKKTKEKKIFPSENEILVKKNRYQFSLTEFQMVLYKIVTVLPAVGSCIFERLFELYFERERQELLAPDQLYCWGIRIQIQNEVYFGQALIMSC